MNPVRVKVGLRVGVSFDPLVISKSVCTQEKVMGAPRSFVALGVVMVGLLGLTVDPVDGSREDAVQVEGVRGTGGVMRRSLPIGDFNIDDITTADEVTPEELEKHLARIRTHAPPRFPRPGSVLQVSPHSRLNGRNRRTNPGPGRAG